MTQIPLKLSFLPRDRGSPSLLQILLVNLSFSLPTPSPFLELYQMPSRYAQNLHQSTAASTWWCVPLPRLGWVEMAVGLPEGPSYPNHSLHFFAMLTLNDRRRAAHSFFKIGRLFSLFSCPSLALLRLLILLLLLMSGNVHPNPGPIFPCSVCTGNVTWWGKSVQCCACSKWVHLRCSQLSLSKFRALGSSHSWSCPPCQNTVTSSSDPSNIYTSTVESSPSSANVALSPHPCLQTSYPPSADSTSSPSPLHHRPLLLAFLLRLLPPLPP